MPISLTSEQVWQALEREVFAVLGMVNAHNEARTAGVVYVLRHHKLYVGTGRDTWKARHIAANPNVSVTVPIAKRVPFMPWLKIPAATITFAAIAHILPPDETPVELRRAVFRHVADDQALMAQSAIIELRPQGEFVTYGVGVPLLTMRTPEKARGRAPVST